MIGLFVDRLLVSRDWASSLDPLTRRNNSLNLPPNDDLLTNGGVLTEIAKQGGKFTFGSNSI